MAGSERISRHRANLFRAILAHVSDPNKLLLQRIALVLTHTSHACTSG